MLNSGARAAVASILMPKVMISAWGAINLYAVTENMTHPKAFLDGDLCLELGDE